MKTYVIENKDNERFEVDERELEAFLKQKNLRWSRLKNTWGGWERNDPRKFERGYKISDVLDDGFDFSDKEIKSEVLSTSKIEALLSPLNLNMNSPIKTQEDIDRILKHQSLSYKLNSKEVESLIEDISSPYKEKIEQSNTYIKAERLVTRKPQTLEECAELFKVDLNIWECVKFTCSNWDVTSTRKGVTATNYSVKAEFKKKEAKVNYEKLIEKFINDVKGNIPKIEPKNYTSKSGNLLEIPLVDLHIGKLAWGEETGEDYDHHIAESRFYKTISDIISRNMNKDIERIVFIVGNDLLHYDTMTKTTTGGTPQDTDIRFQKMFNKACDLMVSAITTLSDLAPVDIVYVPSNHDWQTSYYLLMYLSAWFKDNPNVWIETSPKPRKYYRWGKCLIGFSHGDKEKARIAGIMQIESAKNWGETMFREWHLAHLHSEQVKEENGLIIRNLSSITGTDFWHNQMGYVGAIKKTQIFIWNKETGIVEIQHSVII